MKNIITALNYPELNEKLQKEKNIKIMNKDIVYKEGILEIKKEIHLAIINYDLPGNISIEELIQKIYKINKNIELIFILEKENQEKENVLKKYNIKNIYYNDEITTKKFIQIIQEKNKKTEQELEEEIKELKKIIREMPKEKSERKKKREKLWLKKQSQKTQNRKHNVRKIQNAIVIERKMEDDEKQVAVDLAKKMKNGKKRVLLVDLKLNHEDIHQAFHKEKLFQNIEHKNFFIHIYKNVKLLTGFSKFVENNPQKEMKKIISMIEKNAKKYDIVIIEILENEFSELNQKIMKQVGKYIYMFSGTIYDIKNAKEKIETYKKIKDMKLYLFLDQKKSPKISISILKEIFKKVNILKKEKQMIRLMK